MRKVSEEAGDRVKNVFLWGGSPVNRGREWCYSRWALSLQLAGKDEVCYRFIWRLAEEGRGSLII